jgi:hypothetical protein
MSSSAVIFGSPLVRVMGSCALIFSHLRTAARFSTAAAGLIGFKNMVLHVKNFYTAEPLNTTQQF